MAIAIMARTGGKHAGAICERSNLEVLQTILKAMSKLDLVEEIPADAGGLFSSILPCNGCHFTILQCA